MRPMQRAAACDLPACAPSAESGRGARRRGARAALRRAVARRQAHGVRSRLESLGARCRDRHRDARSRPTASRISATPPTTRDGHRAIAPIVVWSPDSKKIATFQQDQRNVGEMYLVDTKVGHPTLQAWKYPLPGDDVVTMIQRVVIDVDSGKIVRLQMPPDQHRSTLCDDLACRGRVGRRAVERRFDERSPSSRRRAITGSETLRVANAATGEVRDVFEETVPTFFESGNGRVNWRYLPASNEVIWFSERDNWGQLYLYDSESGKLKHQITTGEGQRHAAAARRREDAHALLRGGRQRDGPRSVLPALLSHRHRRKQPEAAHAGGRESRRLAVAVGPYFVDSYSKPDVPPVAVLRDADGKVVMTVEKADISRLRRRPAGSRRRRSP